VLYATGWRGSFWYGALGDAGQWYRARFAAFRVAAGGVWVIRVLFKKSFNSYQQVFSFPGSSIINEGSCPEVACMRRVISARASNLISTHCWDSFDEWDYGLKNVLLNSSVVRNSRSCCAIEEDTSSFQVHLSPHGHLILTSVSGLLVLYFPVIVLIPFIPFLKISFFLPMSLLLSRLFCFKISLSIDFSALRISSVRRVFHLMCCRTNFWKVALKWRNPNPCMALCVAPLILSLGCSGAASASAAFSKEILCRRVF